jgi:uncharacterized protein
MSTMNLEEMRFPDALPVDSYGPGFFRVGGRSTRAPPDPPRRGRPALARLRGHRHDPGRGPRLDVLFVGTGAEMAYLPRASAP